MLLFEILSWILIGLTLGLIEYFFNLWRGEPSQVAKIGAAGAIFGGAVGKFLNVADLDIGAYSMFAFLSAMAFAVLAQAMFGKMLHRYRPAK